jgi:hypothetical protein
MLPRVEYSVTVPVPAELAFRAFCSLDRLLHRGIYEQASWVDGKPWQVGSRLRYVVVAPISATISAVVTSFEPPRSMGLLNHALGVTVEQQVTFTSGTKGKTLIRIIMDSVGKSPDLPEAVIQQALEFFTKDALDSVAVLCKQKGFGSSSRP